MSIDCDQADYAREALAAEGIDLDELIARTPTIVGRAPRLEFRAPAVALSRKSVVWPACERGGSSVTLLELRAGRVQDVLPPSIHPDSRRPYHWLTAPRDGFLELPEPILSLWLDFDAFRRRARNLCPWADPEPEPKTSPRPTTRERTATSVIAAFNEAHDPVAILEAHGYARAGKRRWKSPNVKHSAAPGMVLLPSGRVFCHDSDDPLADERAHDAFDVYAVLKPGGDARAAVKAAAQLLGIRRARDHAHDS